MSTPVRAPRGPEGREGKAVLAIEGATLEWIAADAFTVDPSYDRPANEHRINQLAQGWKDEALGVVFASRRADSDKLYLLDGQHRVGALKKLGRKTDLVPTLTFEGLTVADEAELFVMMNKNRRALTPSELFRASLVEGDKGAQEIKEVMDDLGLELESFGHGPNIIKCVATIWRIYRAMGKDGLDATLSLVLVTWGDDPPPKAAWNQNLLLVLARCLYFGEGRLDLEHLRTTLAKETPEALVQRAASISALQGGHRPRVLAGVILDAYNKGIPRAKQLDPETFTQRKDPFTVATHFQRNRAHGN
jgi:hypothetical protein